MEKEIRSILEDAYPLKEPQESPKTGKYIEINGNRNFVFYNSTTAIVTCLIFLVLFFNPLKEDRPITYNESEYIKEIVSTVAACEGKSRMSVHNELKKKFNYYTYKEIKLGTYKNILKILDSRVCF